MAKTAMGAHYWRFNIITRSTICVTCGAESSSEVHITSAPVFRQVKA